MASFSRVHGSIVADQFQGRTLTYIELSGTGIGTGYGSVGSPYEAAIRALEGFAVVTIIFVPTANVGIVACENVPYSATGPGTGNSLSDWLTAAGAAVTSASGISVTLTSVSLAGTTWS
jgi:hypothetical protein